MPKPITIEMIDAMSPEERKNLNENAMTRETPAAKAILELLSQSSAKASPSAAVKVTRAKPKAAAKAKTA